MVLWNLGSTWGYTIIRATRGSTWLMGRDSWQIVTYINNSDMTCTLHMWANEARNLMELLEQRDYDVKQTAMMESNDTSMKPAHGDDSLSCLLYRDKSFHLWLGTAKLQFLAAFFKILSCNASTRCIRNTLRVFSVEHCSTCTEKKCMNQRGRSYYEMLFSPFWDICSFARLQGLFYTQFSSLKD
jgi:hypothetical protein